MSKFYKLTKSNEIFTYEFLQEINILKESISDKFTKLVIKVGELILSSLISVFINLPDINTESRFVIILKIIGYFLVLLIVFESIIWILKKITRRDNKKSIKNIIALKTLFYTKILNNILIAIDICKKIRTIEKVNLEKIYLYEAFYYFQVSYNEISEKNIIEIYNRDRKEYTEFLKEMNPVFLTEVFDVCIKELEFIDTKAKQYKDANLQKDVKDLIRGFENNISNINKQIKEE